MTENIPKYLTKNWGSLTDFKRFLEREDLEKIQSFSGDELVTDVRRYTLCHSQLIYGDNNEPIR